MNGFLLDTNVPSEFIRERPDPLVIGWAKAQDESTLFLSAVTVGELRLGMEMLSPGRRRRTLEMWLEDDLLSQFEGRILPVTTQVAERWARMTAACRANGLVLSTTDGLIAATALEHGLALATRNTIHFRHSGLTLLDPWQPV